MDKFFALLGDPQGSADVARSDAVVSDLFIETSAIKYFLDADPEYHVIVGSKGTGKSLLLFKKAVEATRKQGVIVAPCPPRKAYEPTFAFASSEQWHAFAALQDKDGRPRLESWGRLWEWALLVTLLHTWRAHMIREDTTDTPLAKELLDLIQPPHDEENPFDLIAQYLDGFEAGIHQSRGRPLLPEARRLQRFVLRHVNDFPPSYIFLDNQDELFFEYPEFWRASGFGCFTAIQELHRISNRRSHFHVTLRPEIIWEVEKCQHYPQWTADIFRLRWEDAELIEVLERRVRHVLRSLLPSPDLVEQDPFGAFVGSQLYREDLQDYCIRVPLCELREAVYLPVRDYLLRHTLRRPREIIMLGNDILTSRMRSDWRECDPGELIRNSADKVAAEQIGVPYFNEVKHRWPWTNGRSADEEMRRFVMRYVRKNILSEEEIREIEHEYAMELGLEAGLANPFARLAAFGLIGWPTQEAHDSTRFVQKFVLPAEENQEALPAEARWYLVHPILYGSPFCVRVVPGLVVGPGLQFHEPSVNRAYKSCFISYGLPDADVARDLHARLHQRGVQAWLFSEDAVAGAPIWSTIASHQRRHAVMLVLCSRNALVRDGVLREIERQIGDGRPIIPISLDEDWQQPSFPVTRAGNDLKAALSNSVGIDFLKLGTEAGFGRLLDALVKSRSKAPHRKSQRGGGPHAKQ